MWFSLVLKRVRSKGQMMNIRSTFKSGAITAILCAGSVSIGLAQAREDSTPAQLDLTLNMVSPTDTGTCRLTFVILNGLGSDIEKLVSEAVLFDAAGRVTRMTLFDFGALPKGRPRVRQFDLAGLTCDALSTVLINGIDTCEGAGITPMTCLDGLRLSTETEVEVTG
ncbi:hypothetical protein ABIE58_003828 [Roseovarius sp. MBR-78]|uniref:hypothetical protein n=1 Tax=Roseovarius sp. MBR-78 TaxID=3156460 RepID=UPI00339409C7